ncbi:hypothetical protein SUGI_0816850 [Cryptomeria japonica]|nr:hypothetical protein SUGI_0816850 [Cryptomeria japonica]
MFPSRRFLEAAVAGILDDGSEDEADGDDVLPGLAVLGAGVFPALGPFTFAVDGSALTLVDGCLKVVLGLLYSPQVGALIGPMVPPFCWRSKVVVYPGAVWFVTCSSCWQVFAVVVDLDLDVLGRLIFVGVSILLIVKFSSESPLMVFVSLSESLPFLVLFVAFPAPSSLEVDFLEFGASTKNNNSKDFNNSFGVGYSMMTTDIFICGPIEVVYNAHS